jgi:hypothetical protein
VQSRRYREHSLTNAAAAAGSAFGLVTEDGTIAAEVARTDFRALGAIAAGLGILAALAVYLLP